MASDDVYYDRLASILCQLPNCRRRGPTQLLPHLYIGNYRDAADHDQLRAMGVTHVLNCAAYRQSDENTYPQESGVTNYMQFHANDDWEYDILQHFDDSRAFIDDALERGGCVLVHCALGVNRSGAICVAYIMLHGHMDLLQVAKLIKEKRGRVLTNRGFQQRIVSFARQHGCLKAPE